jgi:hypothetical protein
VRKHSDLVSTCSGTADYFRGAPQKPLTGALADRSTGFRAPRRGSRSRQIIPQTARIAMSPSAQCFDQVDSARICSTRFIGAIGGRCIGSIGMVHPGTLSHRRQRGIPMHSYENRSQIRALRGGGALTECVPQLVDVRGLQRRWWPRSLHDGDKERTHCCDARARFGAYDNSAKRRVALSHASTIGALR